MGCVASETAGPGVDALAGELCAPMDEAQLAMISAATDRESL
jgi:hypothetical protein